VKLAAMQAQLSKHLFSSTNGIFVNAMFFWIERLPWNRTGFPYLTAVLEL
jgi:hypothetical protein